MFGFTCVFNHESIRMFTKKDIQFLVDQYITGSLDAPGKEQLYRIIQDPAYEEDLAALMDDALAARLATAYRFPETEQRLKQQLLQQIRSTPAVKVHPLRKWWAAAGLALIIASGAWYWQQQHKTTNSFLAQADTIVPPVPGSNKAVLILADGAVIPLDSTGQQEIRQGQTAIRQQKGQLQYIAGTHAGNIGYNTLRTPRGGQFRVTLPDGTAVWLNSASSLRYPTAFQDKERLVELNGQGYFEIAPNATQPFKVKVNGGTAVQVLGTRFDIMAYTDEQAVKTTLLQGAIRVQHGTLTKTLKPGQQALTTAAGDDIAVQETDIQKVTGWRNGLFIFNHTDLPAILREVARWYDVEIVYKAPPNKKLYGGGISRSMALADVLLFLEAGGTNHFKINGKQVIVLP